MKISQLFFRMYVQPALGCFVRALVDAATNAAKTAASTGAALGQTAAGERSFIDPMYRREAQAEHLFDPSQLNEMLTHAGLGAGAGAGALEGSMERQAANSGNAAGMVKAEQQLARDRMKTDSENSLNVAAQDVMGAKNLNQQGIAGEAGLYGQNLKGQLDAMGQVSGDINAATNASKTGWLQDAEGVVNTASNAVKAYKA